MNKELKLEDIEEVIGKKYDDCSSITQLAWAMVCIDHMDIIEK